jgi:5-methylthioadenosine/S-adenosylhomocysteine deaminase
MCKRCDAGHPHDHHHSLSRRDLMKSAAAVGAVAAAGVPLFAARPAFAQAGPPAGTGPPAGAMSLRGGAVLSMDSAVGDFDEADVLVDGKNIAAVGRNVNAGDAEVIDAKGMIVMPGFIDTHHHQFETALRSFLADGLCSTTASRTARSIISTTSSASSRACTGPRTCTSISCSAR